MSDEQHLSQKLNQHQENAKKLVHQCQRAFKSNKPILLVVQYQHHTDKNNFIANIKDLLQQHNINVNDYDLYQDRQYDTGGLYTQFKQDSELNTLSVISSWPAAEKNFDVDPEFITYINLYRDLIGVHNLHIVLFIHESNMAQFIFGAADLRSYSRKTYWLDSAQQDLWSDIAPIPLRNELKKFEPTTSKEELQEYLARGEKLLALQQKPQDKFQVLFDITNWLIDKGFLPKALEFAQQCQQLLEQHKQPPLLELSTTLALLYTNTNQPKLAKTYLNQSLALAEQTKNSELQFTVNLMKVTNDIELGLLTNNDDDTESIEGTLKNIFSALSSTDDSEFNNSVQGLERTLEVINLLIDKGKYQKALKLVDKTIDLQQNNSISLFNLYKLRADILFIVEDFSQAKDYYLKAKQGHNQFLFQMELISIELSLSLADTYLKLDETDNALEELIEIKDIALQSIYKNEAWRVLKSISDILIKRGDFRQAIETAQQMLSISRQANLNEETCMSYLILSWCQSKQEKNEQALDNILNAFEIAQQENLTEYIKVFDQPSKRYNIENGLEGWQQKLEQRKLNQPKI